MFTDGQYTGFSVIGLVSVRHFSYLSVPVHKTGIMQRYVLAVTSRVDALVERYDTVDRSNETLGGKTVGYGLMG